MKQMKKRKLLMTCVAVIMILAAPAFAAKKNVPQFETNGTISGTPLLYENLSINKNGIAAVNIYNPTNKGMTFSASFSFYSSKGAFLAVMTISGYAEKNSRSSHIEEFDYGAIKTARSVKVLGRAGLKIME